jgi:hypothetical protein
LPKQEYKVDLWTLVGSVSDLVLFASPSVQLLHGIFKELEGDLEPRLDPLACSVRKCRALLPWDVLGLLWVLNPLEQRAEQDFRYDDPLPKPVEHAAPQAYPSFIRFSDCMVCTRDLESWGNSLRTVCQWGSVRVCVATVAFGWLVMSPALVVGAPVVLLLIHRFGFGLASGGLLEHPIRLLVGLLFVFLVLLGLFFAFLVITGLLSRFLGFCLGLVYLSPLGLEGNDVLLFLHGSTPETLVLELEVLPVCHLHDLWVCEDVRGSRIAGLQELLLLAFHVLREVTICCPAVPFEEVIDELRAWLLLAGGKGIDEVGDLLVKLLDV